MSADMILAEERAAVAEFARRMVRDGLVVGTSGNISLRRDTLIAVTPSGVDYDTMTDGDIAVVDMDGTVVDGSLKPTTELPFHLACHNRHGAQAVVHTHSTAATALSLLRDDVPFVHYQIAMFGGSVSVAPYATYGTEELVANVDFAMRDRTGCILKHHGTLCIGDSLGKAYDRARQLEWLCDVWLRASAVGRAGLLPADEIDRVVERFGTYGQPQTIAAGR
ncbi:class II aldolase/adducin family protein [Mycobacterium sp. Y57]|uniref:class II aldolase/adducin family protein n=1 Tax=Mycolicibacterium xanthum TaxID=2796469 RepID=UPI001C848AB4|nr:class II aldolase/adducin family protein [Mycolicibacterium xanthum]MBX7431132.1 class II aldolase/adducin family protein [Mycolicibacterium xanthum]